MPTMLLWIVTACLVNTASSTDAESIRFLLNDANHKGTKNRIYISPANASLVNTKLPTVFLAHGYTESANVFYYKDMAAEFLKKGKYNIIAMDWSKLAGSIFYQFSASNTIIAGDAMGEMIVALQKCGQKLADVHVVGFSLGSHVAGYAGGYVQKHLNGSKIGRITCLDPAGPGFYKHFQINTKDAELSKNDASTVVFLHTDRGGLGWDEDAGSVNFNANDGRAIQPGCFLTDIFKYTFIQIVACSHLRAVRIFTESINSNGFVARCTAGNKCSDARLTFGPDVPAGSAGLYRFKTRSCYPYAKK